MIWFLTGVLLFVLSESLTASQGKNHYMVKLITISEYIKYYRKSNNYTAYKLRTDVLQHEIVMVI